MVGKKNGESYGGQKSRGLTNSVTLFSVGGPPPRLSVVKFSGIEESKVLGIGACVNQRGPKEPVKEKYLDRKKE